MHADKRFQVKVIYELRGQTVTEYLYANRFDINTFRDNPSSRSTTLVVMVDGETEDGQPIDSVVYANVYRISRHPQ